MSEEIEQALNLALRRLVSQITRNGELVKFETKLQKRKQYDLCEKDYIENQRLRKQLGNEYESSDSQDEKQNNFNNLPKYQLKRMLRKKLIERRFDEDVLLPIPVKSEKEENDKDEFTTTKFLAQQGGSTYDIRQTTELNMIQEAKEIVQDYQEEKQTNFGLEFLIKELQKIEKLGIANALTSGFST